MWKFRGNCCPARVIRFVKLIVFVKEGVSSDHRERAVWISKFVVAEFSPWLHGRQVYFQVFLSGPVSIRILMRVPVVCNVLRRSSRRRTRE